jgi:GR25 family glycosyltransferase involved in LPS biosynthesis
MRTDVTAPREVASQASLCTLTASGVQYTERVSRKTERIPEEARAFCRRPLDIAPDGQPGYMRITPPAWGCYKAHRDALAALSDAYDYTLICECDANLAVPVAEFCWIMDEAIARMVQGNVYAVNLGPDVSISLPHEEAPYGELFVNAWYQIPLNGYLVPNRAKEWYRQRIQDSEWDSADMWMNHMFYHHREVRLRTLRRFIGFFPGPSLIDNDIKICT